jgi:hypothetical protein
MREPDSSHAGMPDYLLRPSDAAAFLDLTPRFLEMRRFRGGGPPFIRVSRRCVRYLMSDLQTWVEERRRTSTADMGDVAP